MQSKIKSAGTELPLPLTHSPSSTSFLAAASSSMTLGTNLMTADRAPDGDAEDGGAVIRIFFLEL